MKKTEPIPFLLKRRRIGSVFLHQATDERGRDPEVDEERQDIVQRRDQRSGRNRRVDL